MDAKDQIKQRLNIVDIVSEYVQLKKAGTNYKGLCPFHNEKSPSFMVTEDKQIFHCFGCQEGGDVLAFVQKVENLDFRETLELLAPKAGVQLENYSPEKSKGIARTKDVLDSAKRFYHKVLMSSHGKEALDYLHSRGLSDFTIEVFALGYAPDSWDTLLKALYSKKYNDTEIVNSGLAIRNEKGKVYDRFRGRITFPINDTQGNVVGFTSRILPSKDDGKQGKYINTPQTEVYNKSEVLFGLDKAKKAIKQEGFAIIVEGNMDVIMSFQAGVENIVASSGTALTIQQVQLLKRYTDTLYLSFDQDAAGKQAAIRGVDIALQEGMNIKVIEVAKFAPEGKVKDTADLVVLNPQLWKDAVQASIPMMEYFINELIIEFDIRSAQGKKLATDSFKQQLKKLPSIVEQDHWIALASQKFDVDPSLLKSQTSSEINPLKRFVKTFQNQATPQQNQYINRDELSARALYSIALNSEKILSYLEEKLNVEIIPSRMLKALFKSLFLYYNSNKSIDYVKFTQTLEDNPSLYEAHIGASLVFEKEYASLNQDELEQEVSHLIQTLTKASHKYAINTLQQQLQEAEMQGDKEKIAQLMQQISHHTKNLNT